MKSNKKIRKKFIMQIKDAIDGFGITPTVNSILAVQDTIKTVVFECYATNKLLGVKECFKETTYGIEVTASYVYDDIRVSLSIPTASFMIDFDFDIKDEFKQELAILDSTKIENLFDFNRIMYYINSSVDPDIYRRDLFINDILGHIFVPLNVFNIIVLNEKKEVKEIPYIAGFLSDGKNIIVHSIRSSYFSKRIRDISLSGIDSVTMQIIKLKKTNWNITSVEAAVNRVTKFYIDALSIDIEEYISNFKNAKFSDDKMREYSLEYESIKIAN